MTLYTLIEEINNASPHCSYEYYHFVRQLKHLDKEYLEKRITQFGIGT